MIRLGDRGNQKLFETCTEPLLRLLRKQTGYDDEPDVFMLDRMLNLGNYFEDADYELQSWGGTRVIGYTFTAAGARGATVVLPVRGARVTPVPSGYRDAGPSSAIRTNSRSIG